jgi:hypothetical protein
MSALLDQFIGRRRATRCLQVEESLFRIKGFW